MHRMEALRALKLVSMNLEFLSDRTHKFAIFEYVYLFEGAFFPNFLAIGKSPSVAKMNKGDLYIF